MCLIAWNWQPHSNRPLLLLSNRDEFYARPTSPVFWWPGVAADPILAGKDLQAGGTWLGLSRSGRLAAITNFRHPGELRPDALSRGELVAGFLQGSASAQDYLCDLAARAHLYNPFNLLVYDGQHLLGLESRNRHTIRLAPGIGALSNADFHTPWPKLTRLTKGLRQKLQDHQTQPDQLLPLLLDTQAVTDADLPQTGVPLATERQLSTAFVSSSTYGTRSCSVVTVHTDHATMSEHCFGAQGFIASSDFSFHLTPAPKPTAT